ncbi:MAG: hypothetical protein PHW85_03890 [Bacteroidales bacterium]|nr:hypothetical protein [Bacteroidales bacterium]
MTESDLKDYIREHYSQEDERCEWKELGSFRESKLTRRTKVLTRTFNL